MDCVGSEKITELEFVQQVIARRGPECVGPLVKLGFSPAQLDACEQSLQHQPTFDFLLGGYVDEGDVLYFAHCALHWLDLSHTAWRTARAAGFLDGLVISQQILGGACEGAGLDPKEISNLFVWRRVSLT